MKYLKTFESDVEFKPLPKKDEDFNVYYRISLEGPGTKLENFNLCLDKLGTSINYNVSIKDEYYIYSETEDTSLDELIKELIKFFKNVGIVYLFVWYDPLMKYYFEISKGKEDFPGFDYYGDIYVNDYSKNVGRYNL